MTCWVQVYGFMINHEDIVCFQVTTFVTCVFLLTKVFMFKVSQHVSGQHDSITVSQQPYLVSSGWPIPDHTKETDWPKIRYSIEFSLLFSLKYFPKISKLKIDLKQMTSGRPGPVCDGNCENCVTQWYVCYDYFATEVSQHVYKPTVLYWKWKTEDLAQQFSIILSQGT